jgi:hypothetical protein
MTYTKSLCGACLKSDIVLIIDTLIVGLSVLVVVARYLVVVDNLFNMYLLDV